MPESYDPAIHPNGSCDVCGAPVADAEPGSGPRMCPVSPWHDPYSDGWQNGGDPIRPADYRG